MKNTNLNFAQKTQHIVKPRTGLLGLQTKLFRYT
jgi:hypothetical protein